MVLQCWLSQAVLCWGLRWASPLREASVLSHRADKLLFWMAKPLPRNTGMVSEETQLGGWKTTGFSEEPKWVFICMVRAGSLLPLCVRWHHHSKTQTPLIVMEENPSPYYWKSNSKCNMCSILPFVFAFCVFSLCQELLKSVLWLWHWGRQVRQILHTHTHTRSEQTRHPVFRNKQRKEIWESHCSCQDI